MLRKIEWTHVAWKEYVYWQTQDRKNLQRINKLVEATVRNPFEGIGKPEALRENLSRYWSRRIDDTHRLVYAVDEARLTIIACRYHYG